MSNGAILEEIHELGEPPDDTELALDTIPDLLDKIEQDLKVIDFFNTYLLVKFVHSIARIGMDTLFRVLRFRKLHIHVSPPVLKLSEINLV